MTTDSSRTTVLVLGDREGNLYALTEEAIRTCRATAEQQHALEQIVPEDVTGFATPAGGSLVALGAITVAPQINTNVGFNIAAATFAPVNQVLGQTGLNAFSGFAPVRI